MLGIFVQNAVPAAVNAAMMMQQMGREFNVETYLTNMAEEMGITDLVVGVFDDPELQRRLQSVTDQAGLDPGKAGKASGAQMAGTLQNNGNAQAVPVNNSQQQFNQDAQAGAATAQSQIAGGF